MTAAIMRTLRWFLAAVLSATAALAVSPVARAQDAPVSEGELVAVDLSTGHFTIKHGPIVNLGITRDDAIDQFKVADPVMLNAVQPGHHIRFTADRIKGELTITAIRP